MKSMFPSVPPVQELAPQVARYAQDGGEGMVAETVTYRLDVRARGIAVQESWALALWMSGNMSAASFGFPDETPVPWPGAGLFSLAPAGVPISWQMGPGEMRALVCRFSPERFAELTGLHANDRDYDFRKLLRIGNTRGGALRETMKQLSKELLAPAVNSEKMVETLCIQAALYLGRLLQDVGRSGHVAQGGLAPWQLQRLQESAADLATGRGDLKAVAQACGVGPRHFARAFRQSTGRTLADYLAEVRLGLALELLSGSLQPVAEIAAMLGFAHPSGFSIAFRRATGESPRAYRRRRGGPVGELR